MKAKPVSPNKQCAEIPAQELDGVIDHLQNKILELTAQLDKEIVERKNLETALAASEKQFQHPFQNATIGMVITELDQSFRQVNKTFCDMLGYTESELLKLSIVDVTHPEDLQISVQGSYDLVNNKQTHDVLEKRYIHKNGSVVWAVLTRSLIRDEKGMPLYFVAQVQNISELIRQKREIQDSEIRYRALFENCNDGIIVREFKSRKIVDVNDVITQRLGYSKSELIGFPIDKISPQPDQKERERRLKLIEQGGDRTVERIHRRKDGTEFPVEITISRLNTDGQDLIFSVVRDVSERKEAEKCLRSSQKALAISEMRFRDFAESAADRFWEIDEQFRFTYISPPPKGTARFAFSDMIGKTRWELPGVDSDSEHWKQHRQDLEAHRPIRHFQYHRNLYDGSKVWIRVTGKPRFDSNGVFIGYRGTNLDVTDEVQTKDAIQRTRQRFFDAMDNLDAGFVLWDENDRFVYCNKYFYEYQGEIAQYLVPGVKFEEYIRKAAESRGFVVAGGDLDKWVANKLAIRRSGHGEQEETRKNGRTYRVKLQKLDDGSIVAFHFDVTELKKRQYEAEAANLAKSKFLSSMSHEIRTPLNSVLGFQQLLASDQKEPPTKRQSKYLEYIAKSGKHLLELIEQVLELSKIEAGAITLSIEDVDLRSVVKECVDMLSSRMAEKHIRLTNDCADKDLPEVSTDRMRLRQILLNLLSNAVKYNREGGSIEIDSLETGSGMLRISIKDSGVGISEERQNYIFEPFNRLGWESQDIEGTGIGLTITKQLVDSLGCGMGFDSEKNVGSTFWLEVPIVSSEIDTEQVDLGVTNPGSRIRSRLKGLHGRNITVLYIEDNPGNLELMECVLEDFGNITLISSSTAELGAEKAKEQQPNVIFMDLGVPGMGGIAAMKKLHTMKETKNIPVIALTAAALPEDIEKGKRAGFHRYLTKPINVEEVLEAIGEHV